MTARYTKDHEWIRIDGEFAYLGISQYAQEQLGDVVFVELPEPGKNLASGDVAAVVESVKAASEVFTPAEAEVVAVNAALADTPALVNASPEGDGWFMKLKLAHPGEIDGLMDAAAYKSFTDTL